MDVFGRQWVRKMTASSRSVEDEPIFTAVRLSYGDQFVCDPAVNAYLSDKSQTNVNLYCTSSDHDLSLIYKVIMLAVAVSTRSAMHHAQSNATAAQYWMHSVLNENGYQDYTSPSCK